MHIALAETWFVATVARVSPAVVAVFLAATSSCLVVAWMALPATKFSLLLQELSLLLQGYFNSSQNDTLKVPEL